MRLDFAARGGYGWRMPLSDRDRTRLVRILKLLGSDQPGERASAALAAHRLMQSLETDWDELLAEPPATKVIVQRVREWDINHRDAAEARIRQLKDTTERQERQLRAMRTRINTLMDRERLRRQAQETD